MTVKLIGKFVKPGAVFASAQVAHADRKSLWSDQLTVNVGNSVRLLREKNIIISGPDISWNPDTCMLTIERVVTDYDEFCNCFIQNSETVFDDIAQASTAAGWQRIDYLIVQETAE